MRVHAPLLLLVVLVVARLAAGGGPAAAVAPEIVSIGASADWFAPVAMPHAAHAELVGDCGGCHHHSDGEAVPCATCHESRFSAASADRPLLVVAYHRQCLVCHRETGAGTGCEDCHARRRLPPGAPLGAAPPG